MQKQISSKIVSLVFAVLVVGFLAVFYVLAWTEPLAPPPGDNVPAPINAGDIEQMKSGALRIGGVFRTDTATHLAVTNGNVGIGTITPSEKLDVVGNIQVDSASDVCIDGGNCLSDTGGAGSAIICQSFAGAAPVGDLCPDCYLEDRNQMIGGYRYLLSNDSASITHRCIELGYDWGYATSSYAPNEWCFYSNARVKRWIGGIVGWQRGGCENYAVKSAECCER